MEIMNTKKYNEKLDIKPMSRTQLMSRSWDIFGQLKDGDVVIVHCDTMNGIEDVRFVFVSEESMRKYAYAKTYNFTLYTSNLYSDRQHGTLIAYYSNKFSYTLFSKFRRNGEYKADRSGYRYMIKEIRRYDKPPYQPFSDLYFQQIGNYGNYTILYSNSITTKISEKLNIRPISKSQLGLYKTKTVTINGQIWAAENASSTRANDGSRLVEGLQTANENLIKTTKKLVKNTNINIFINIKNRVGVTVLRNRLLKQLGNGAYEPKKMSKDKVKDALLSYRASINHNAENL